MSDFKVEHLKPEGLFLSKAYSQAIAVSGRARTIYIGGQNAINEEGDLVGIGDLAAQTRQTLKNIAAILASQNATFADVVKLNIYLLHGSDPLIGYNVFQEVAGPLDHPPLITVLFVAGVGRPGCMLEIDGIAVVEDKG